MDHPQGGDDVPCGNGWSDARFLELARNGGKDEAYRLLFEHLTNLRGHLTSRYLVELGGQDGVEEMVHLSAWKATEGVSSYRRERGGVLAWAFRTGRNIAVDRIRSDQARHARERSVARDEVAQSGELLRAVQEAIACIPDPYRTVLEFDLERGEGSSSELATKFRVPVQTVYNWRHRAHELIAPLLRPMIQ